MMALDDTRADPGLLLQLERRLKQVPVQPRRRIEAGQLLERRCSFKSPVAYKTADDRAVLLLDHA